MRIFVPSITKIPGLTDLEPHASGGMAEVYRAWDPRRKRHVAVKVLSERACVGAECDDYAARFARECETAVSLKHPNLVKSYKTGEVDGRPYLVMEFIDGPSVGRRVRAEGPLGREEALDILEQVIAALAYMHERGFVHRDIKPSNILLTADGTAKLADFGLAKTIDDPSLTIAGGVLGTPHFLAPEQIDGRHPVDQRADIYSLGATLFFMLVGEPPFKGKSIPLVLTRQMTDPLPFPKSWRDDSHDREIVLLRRMTAKAPGERYQDVVELAADLAWVRGAAEAPLDSGIFRQRVQEVARRLGADKIDVDLDDIDLPDEPNRLVAVPAGKVLFYEDDVASAVFWLVNGKMEVLRGGRRLAVITQSKKVLGEMAIVPGALRTATLRALADSVVLRIETDELTHFLSRHPQLMQAILADMAERIDLTSTRLLQTEQRLDTLRATLLDLAERVADGQLDPAQLVLALTGLVSDDGGQTVA